jgi:hypothetical protein
MFLVAESDAVADPASVAAPRRRAGRDEQLRHLDLVQVVADREVRLGSERVEDGEDLVLLDEPADRLHHLSGVVGVVDDAVVDRPLRHAAAGVGELEVRLSASGDRGVRGGRAGERRRPADDDGRRADAGIRRRAGEGDRQPERHRRERPA